MRNGLLKQIFSQSEALPRSGWWCVIRMEFLRSILRRHFAGKPVVRSRNVFLRPWGYRLTKVALVPSPSGRLLWISDSPREKWNITLGKEFFDNTQRRKTLTKNVKKRIVNNRQLFLEPEWALSQGLWLGGHEGERNNCFSKIQLVGKKNIKTKQLWLVKARL